MNEKLKPCPFCGGKAELDEDYDSGNIFWVFCTRCGISTDTDYVSKEAIKAWNRRPK